MARKLSALPQTQFSGIDFSNIVSDVQNLITNSPDYNKSWDDFFSSDAGRMLIELFAYIADNLATRIDWIANENWLATATQKSSVMRILKILGYNFTLPIASQVTIQVKTADAAGYPTESFPTNGYYLTPQYNQGISFTPFSLTANDLTGAVRTYEAISWDNVNNKYDYKNGLLVTSNDQFVIFYDGITYVETFTVTTDNGFSFNLSKAPVIDGSARVYFAVDNPSSGLPYEVELIKVDSFLEPEAQMTTTLTGAPNPIPYVQTVNENDGVTISFSTTALLPDALRRPAIGDKIRVFYRSGGGLSGNLTINAINSTQLLTISPWLPRGGFAPSVNLHVSFVNNSSGQFGQDSESIDHAIVYAPLSVRTVEKAVTPEDYDILLNANNTVATSVSFGSGNAPSNAYSKYGVNIQPTEVWNYVVRGANHSSVISTSSVNPSSYNDVYWMTYALENRFNELHNFRAGSFNNVSTFTNSNILGKTKLKGDSIIWGADSNADPLHIFRNYVYLTTPQSFKNTFYNNIKFKAKATNVSDNIQLFNNLTNLTVSDTIYPITSGDTITNFSITNPIRSYFISSVDLSNGVDLTSNKYLRLNIDNRGDTVIDLTQRVVTSIKSSHPWEIASSINAKLQSLPSYGYKYSDSTGVLGGATVVKYGNGAYLKLQGDTFLGADTLASSIIIRTVNTSNPASPSDATSIILGPEVAGDTYVNYGYIRLSLVHNTGLSSYGNIIYEIGSSTFGPYKSDTIYLHYLTSDTSAINLGTYYYNNFSQTSDYKWRPVANRVYNAVLNADSSPNLSLSDFQLAFTKNPTSSPSLYAINNDWNLNQSSPAYVTGPTVGDTITFAAGHNQLKVAIDNKAMTTLNLVDAAGGSHYTYKIADTINAQLQTAYISDTLYKAATFVYYDPLYKRITIKSPYKTNTSRVALASLVPSAKYEIFGLSESFGDSFHVNGDYYLQYSDTHKLMQMIKTIPSVSQVPDASFYTHFIWDRRNDTATDEYYYQQNVLKNVKIMGIDNTFKQPIFQTFDIAGTIYYNALYTQGEVSTAIESAIQNAYSFKNPSTNAINRDFGDPIVRSKIENLIHEQSGVEYVVFDYFGLDYTDKTTNQTNLIETDFDTITVLSENISSGTSRIHGLIFEYKVFGT